MNINLQREHVPTVTPHSLRDAPSFIESQFPVGRVSAESYKERKAVSGQTLTTIGSYWKGRKPLILVRAVILGCLLPKTDNPVGDLQVFLMLMGMHDESFVRRAKDLSPSDIDVSFEAYLELIDPPEGAGSRPKWRAGISPEEKSSLIAKWVCGLPYDKRLGFCLRPEEVGHDLILLDHWKVINNHLGTSAKNLPDLIEQLGIMRYGRRPVVADTFSGSGSIPFEAARLGCDAHASDLNPIACMLTWGAFNVAGAAEIERKRVADEQAKVEAYVLKSIEELGVEKDSDGAQAKAYIYCLETKCPKTGWLVPMVPTFIISESKRVVGKLVPDDVNKRYEIEIVEDATSQELDEARGGTLRDGSLVHPRNPETSGVSIATIRGDYRSKGDKGNKLRLWEKSDIQPRQTDILQERLYCIEWFEKNTRRTTFKAPAAYDLVMENKVASIVKENLARWQLSGLVSSDVIVTGKENEGPIRTNGWTHWHHMFVPRAILTASLIREAGSTHPIIDLGLARYLDNNSKGCRWKPSQSGAISTFDSQALKTHFNWGYRTLRSTPWRISPRRDSLEREATIVLCHDARSTDYKSDIFVTDPPYADAVRYEEITEFFIAWIRHTKADAFSSWTWNSQRHKAVKGSDEKFRTDMVSAYQSMAAHMPDNGMQVVMFTHQDAGVWSDLASIMWAAGLRVTAAWNIVTETESALKEGNYVQGTILLVLRKRLEAGNIKRMDIEGEIEEAVDHQLATLHDLDEDWTSERLYTDGDLQLAAYAAALRVITGYATIDRKEVGADVYRKLAKGEKTVIRELIEYAAMVANNKLVPDGFPPAMWRDLDAPSRFYVRMLDMESKGTTKFADYQDFARTFSVSDYADLMDSTRANAASLAGSGALKGRILGSKGFGSSPLRRVLFATHKTMQKDDPREGLAFLRTELGQDYWPTRAKLVALAKYVSTKTARTRPVESSAADLLGQRLEVDKV